MQKTIPFGAIPIAKPATIPFGNVQQQQPNFPVEEPAPIKRTFANKILNFIGGEKIGQGLGQGLNQGAVTQQLAEEQSQDAVLQQHLFAAIKKNKAEGKDTTRLEGALKDLSTSSGQTGQGAEDLYNPAHLTTKQVVGDALQAATTAAGVKIPTGGKFVAKVAEGAATGYGLDVSQNLKNDQANFKPGMGTAVGAALPVVGAVLKPVTGIIGRLFKGLGAGLSGASSTQIDEFLTNPKLSAQVSKEFNKSGNAVILEKNAKAIVNGVSTIKKEASAAYRTGLEQLAKEDVAPKTFRSSVQKVLDKYGSSVKAGTGQRTLANVEFDDPKNIKKASELIDRLSNTELDGKSLRHLADDIENAAYKTATSDERLSFNKFVSEMSDTLKTAINSSTGDKLTKINAAYSRDVQLAESIEAIFGKVKFKNMEEVNRVSQQLETLFSKKGLSPEYINNFLEQAGIGQGLKTSEAVRQIKNMATKANTKGLSIGELIQQVTSSVVTPNAVKNIAIATGWSKQVLGPVLEKLTPAARVTFLKLISGAN